MMWRQTSRKWDLEDGGERWRIYRNGGNSFWRPRPFKGCSTVLYIVSQILYEIKIYHTHEREETDAMYSLAIKPTSESLQDVHGRSLQYLHTMHHTPWLALLQLSVHQLTANQGKKHEYKLALTDTTIFCST
jgi:hypothetical protein